MALKSIQTTKATIQMRHGMEQDFDPDQMTTGEWAVSTDSKKVWMCFMPGLVLRMATYEAFEKDMEEIRAILVEAKDIEKAITLWSKLAESYARGGTGAREGEDTDNAKYYSEQARIYAENAEAVSGGIGIMTTEKAGIGKPDGETITADEDGTLRVIGGGGATGDFASKEIYGDTAVSLGRAEGSTVGNRSVAYGYNLKSTADGSVAFGSANESSGKCVITSGYKNVASGNDSSAYGLENLSIGVASASFGNNSAAVDDYSLAEGCGSIALGYGSHVENCQNIAGAKYLFKIASYNSTAKSFTFDDTYEGFSKAFGQLSTGSRLHIANVNYINDASIYTISEIGSDGKSVTVSESIPVSNYQVLFATLIKPVGNFGGCHAEGRKSIALNTYAHAEGYQTEARGYCSHTEGNATKATDNQSHAEGFNTTSSGAQSHAEGYGTTASGKASHSEGGGTSAIGARSHSEGYNTTASGDSSHSGGYLSKSSGEKSFAHGDNAKATKSCSAAFGNQSEANGLYSFSCGSKSIASGEASFCEGRGCSSVGDASHSEGDGTSASGGCSHSEGKGTVAIYDGAHAEGYYTQANHHGAHAEGYYTQANGFYAHAEGSGAIASASTSHAEGYHTTALEYQHAQGHYNNTSLSLKGVQFGTSSGTAFVVGNGTETVASNAARIDYNGKFWCKQAYSSTGADYAELFEWEDGNPNNEDRRGYFTTMVGKKIKKASAGDYILGIVSGNPCVIGNTDMEWYGQFMRDEFGSFIKEKTKETVKEPAFDEEGNPTEIEKEIEVEFYKVNPDYDPNAQYTFRLDRPEWDAVGMVGVLPVRDDGTCEVGRYCRCADGGIATMSKERSFDTYMVIERISENIVSVILK